MSSDPTVYDLCKSLFDHQAASPWWMSDVDEPEWNGSATDLVRLATEMFERPGLFEDSYEPTQIANGLDFLISSGGEALLWRLASTEVPWDTSQCCLRAIPMLFERYFAPRCPTVLEHADASHESTSMVCFMWWDAADCYPRQASQERPEFDSEVLEVMESILSIESHGCQESALHGFGEWQLGYPQHVKRVIGRYLEISHSIPPELREYAERAAQGDII